jgi:hypothetical protein
MRSSLLGCALVLFALSSCASRERGAQPTKGVTNVQGAGPAILDQGWAALVEADREMKALATIRDGAADPFQRRAIDRRIAELSARSNKLIDDMALGDGRGRVRDTAIRADVATLHRAMHAGAAAEMQGVERGLR